MGNHIGASSNTEVKERNVTCARAEDFGTGLYGVELVVVGDLYDSLCWGDRPVHTVGELKIAFIYEVFWKWNQIHANMQMLHTVYMKRYQHLLLYAVPALFPVHRLELDPYAATSHRTVHLCCYQNGSFVETNRYLDYPRDPIGQDYFREKHGWLEMQLHASLPRNPRLYVRREHIE